MRPGVSVGVGVAPIGLAGVDTPVAIAVFHAVADAVGVAVGVERIGGAGGVALCGVPAEVRLLSRALHGSVPVGIGN